MADPVVWSTLPKAQDDSQTIAAAIAAAIADHNDDPTAHIGSSQSLGLHRTNEILDHPSGSVVPDKAIFARTMSTTFQGLTGLDTYGLSVAHFGALQLYTTASSGNLSILSGAPNVFEPVDWSKTMYLRIVAKVSSVTAMLALLGVGCDDQGDGTTGFGFRITSGTLEAYHALDSGSGAVFTTQTITGYTLTDWHVYEAIFDPVAGTLTFYIDGDQVAQFTSGLPSTVDDNALLFEIKTTAAAAKYLYSSNFVLSVGF